MRVPTLLTTVCTAAALTAALTAGYITDLPTATGTGPAVARVAARTVAVTPSPTTTPATTPAGEPGPLSAVGSWPVLHVTTSTVSATPLSSDPATCTMQTVTLPDGLYSHGLTFGFPEGGYYRYAIPIAAGDYTMTDCLIAADGAVVQIAQLRPASAPRTSPALSTITDLRVPPPTGRTVGWGSMLYRTADRP